MIGTFTATGVYFSDDEFLDLQVGPDRTDGPEIVPYLAFQRGIPIGSPEDMGIFIEFCEQATCGYDKIRSCELSRERLAVRLTEPLDDYETFSVALHLTDGDRATLAGGLRKLFAGKEHLLHIEDEARPAAR